MAENENKTSNDAGLIWAGVTTSISNFFSSLFNAGDTTYHNINRERTNWTVIFVVALIAIAVVGGIYMINKK